MISEFTLQLINFYVAELNILQSHRVVEKNIIKVRAKLLAATSHSFINIIFVLHENKRDWLVVMTNCYKVANNNNNVEE